MRVEAGETLQALEWVGVQLLGGQGDEPAQVTQFLDGVQPRAGGVVFVVFIGQAQRRVQQVRRDVAVSADDGAVGAHGERKVSALHGGQSRKL